MLSRIALTALCVLGLALSASAQLHKDTRLGYQIKPPGDYEAVAISPTESFTVAKFQSTKKSTNASHKYRYNVLAVMFLPESLVPEGQPRHEFLEELIDKRKRADGLSKVEKVKEFSIDRQPAMERHLLPEDSTTTVYEAYIDQPEGVFMIIASAFNERFDKESKDFRAAARSFKRIEKDAVAEGDDEGGREAYLQELIAGLPRGWDHERTDRMLLLSNADKRFSKEAGAMLEGTQDALRKLLPPREEWDYVLVVRLCKDKESYKAFGGSGNTASHFDPRSGEVVAFDKAPREDAMASLRYSSYNQYAHFRDAALKPHAWYRIGHARYMSGAELSNSNKVKSYEEPSTLTRALRSPVSTASERFVPSKEFFALEPDAFGGSKGWLYRGQAWALVHFLHSRKVPKSCRTLLDDYMQNMAEARLAEATEEMEKAQKQWARNKELGIDPDEGEKPPSDLVFMYFGDVDDEKVRARAFEATFGDWSDKDWKDFDKRFLAYASKL